METLEERRRNLVPCFSRDLDRIERGEDVTHYFYPYLNELLESYQGGMSRRQVLITFTKWMHGFNCSDPVKDFDYLLGEVEEAREALQMKTFKEFLEELADVAIYCYGIAQMYGVDFDTIIEHKMDYNIRRSYSLRQENDDDDC